MDLLTPKKPFLITNEGKLVINKARFHIKFPSFLNQYLQSEYVIRNQSKNGSFEKLPVLQEVQYSRYNEVFHEQFPHKYCTLYLTS